MTSHTLCFESPSSLVYLVFNARSPVQGCNVLPATGAGYEQDQQTVSSGAQQSQQGGGCAQHRRGDGRAGTEPLFGYLRRGPTSGRWLPIR